MSAKLIWAVSVIAGTVLVGCSGNEDYAQASQPKSYVFQGRVDREYAGTWKAANGISTMKLGKDGSMRIESVAMSRNGKVDDNVSGDWLLNGQDIMFRYPSDRGQVTLKYSAKLSGNTLVLQQIGLKTKMVYKRR